MRGAAGVLMLIAARARRAPRRWVLPLLGIAVAVAFAGAVAAESEIVADRQARSALQALSPLDRAVRITWQGPVTPAVDHQARRVLDGLDVDSQTYVTLLNPVRLSGVIVRPAAIAPLTRWLRAPAAGPASRLGPCRPRACPMLLAGGSAVPSHLEDIGVHLTVTGGAVLRSDLPLGYAPDAAGPWPVLLTGDPTGLDGIDGLSGVYRTHSWVGSLAVADIHEWTLTALERRLQRAQAELAAGAGQFALSAPFTALASAREQADQASSRLLLAGGGAAVTLVLFLAVASAALRREQLSELERLRRAGATLPQATLFVCGETGWLVAAGIVGGFGAAALLALVLAAAAGEPGGAVLLHSVLAPVAAPVLAGGWLAATAASGLAFLPASGRLVDVLAAASLAWLTADLISAPAGAATSTLLLAPLACLAAGVILLRAMSWLLRAGEQVARRGPLSTRLALVGLARAPSLPALAVASLAVSLGLGGFALAYRATLDRGAADQAADRVPLDALLAPGPSFATPLELAPPRQWRALASGPVLPVRRTEASYAAGDGYATVPALGIPAGGLTLVHGWRSSDGSAPLQRLAARLRPTGPVRTAGPALPPTARMLSIAVRSPQLAVTITADLRSPDGAIRQVPMGTAAPRERALRASLPRGHWELAALELDEPTGLDITAAHQNGENPAAATQFSASLSVGPLRATDTRGAAALDVPLGAWRGAGAASGALAGSVPAHSPSLLLHFQTTGSPGIVRPPQPFDSRPIPVLVDPATAATTGPQGRLGLSIDQLPVSAQVVGVLRRFPTIDPDAAGFVIADEATLASALDAQLPGQGRPDELWIASRRRADRLAAIRHALQTGPLAQLTALYRADVERGLRDAPLQRGLLGTLLAAAAISGTLAVAGLLLVLLGPFRDRQTERDLEEQGLGPRGLRAHLVRRASLSGCLGVLPGLGIALILDLVAVAALGGAALGAPPRPPLVAVIPWGQLVALGAGAAASVALAAWIATRALFTDHRRGPPSHGGPAPAASEPTPLEELVR